MSAYLENLEKLLLLKHSVFEIDCDSLLLIGLRHSLPMSFITELTGSESVHSVEATHDAPGATNASVGCVRTRELALHKHLRVFAGLSAKLNLALVHRFEGGRQLRLRLIAIQSPTSILTLTAVHGTTMALRPESRLGVHVRWLLARATCMTLNSLNQVIIVSRLPPLVEWVLTTTGALPRLHRLETVPDVCSLRAGKNLLAVLLEDAWQLDAGFHARAPRLEQ